MPVLEPVSLSNHYDRSIESGVFGDADACEDGVRLAGADYMKNWDYSSIRKVKTDRGSAGRFRRTGEYL
jgi:hypothetical protein